MTRGFGYFYLGQRAAGFAVLIGLGILQQMILSSIKGDKEGGALFMELILAGMAVHAYRIARKGEKEILATIQLAQQSTAMGRPQPGGPDWFGATDWRGIHWTEWPRFFHARLLRNSSNRGAHLPGGSRGGIHESNLWPRDTGSCVMVSRRPGHKAAGQRPPERSSLRGRTTARGLVPNLVRQLLCKGAVRKPERPENKSARIVQNGPATLDGLSARDIVLTLEQAAGQITEHQIVTSKDLTLYVLTIDSLTDSIADCESDFRFIRERVALPK